MYNAAKISNYERFLIDAYAWRKDLSLTYKVILAVGMAIITALMAHLKFYLPNICCYPYGSSNIQ